jgi:hypothetical protein
MHKLIYSSEIQDAISGDVWSLTLGNVENLAALILGSTPDGWIRRGQRAALIVKIKDGKVLRAERGALACRLEEELEILSRQAQLVLNENRSDSALRAAAFFHLRFESVHPLRDGNGRVGRTIMAAQCGVCCGLCLNEAISVFNDYDADYRRVFGVRRTDFRFALLLDMLTRMFAVQSSDDSPTIKFPIEPLFQDPSPVPPIDCINVGDADYYREVVL